MLADDINIKNNCRLDNFCDDNLKVDNPVIFYLDGKKWIPLAANSALSSNTEPRLKWTARVTNQDGEDAYNAGFTTKLPVFFKSNKFEIEPGIRFEPNLTILVLFDTASD